MYWRFSFQGVLLLTPEQMKYQRCLKITTPRDDFSSVCLAPELQEDTIELLAFNR